MFGQFERSLKNKGFYLDTVMAGAVLLGRLYSMTTGKQVIGGTAAPRSEALTFSQS